MIFILIISTLILIVAIVIANFGAEVVEDEQAFLKVVGIFLLIYVIVVAVTVYLFKTHRLDGFSSANAQTTSVTDGSDNSYGYK